MDIRQLAEDYAVSPQIDPVDAARVKAAGFTTIICNRPDSEVPPDQRSSAVQAASEAAGLRFVYNPVTPMGLTMQNVNLQGETLAKAHGPVFAYCASGNRSSIVWALSQAGLRPTDELIRAGALHGYKLESLREQIEVLAARRAEGG